MIKVTDTIRYAKLEIMTDDVRTYFLTNANYLVTRDTKTGFQRDSDIQAGTKIKYSDSNYSHYDGYFSCNFENIETKERVSFWIQEDTTKQELEESFKLFK